MNKKKTGLIALVLFLIVAIGIGYAAASSQSVTINGTASATTGDFSIIFDKTKAVTTSKEGSDSINVVGAYGDNDTTATMTVKNLKAAGDKAIATYTVKNASTQLKANIKALVTADTKDTSHYKVTVTPTTDTPVEHGQTTEVTVTVELIKAFADEVKASQEVTFTITATGEAAEAN